MKLLDFVTIIGDDEKDKDRGYKYIPISTFNIH